MIQVGLRQSDRTASVEKLTQLLLDYWGPRVQKAIQVLMNFGSNGSGCILLLVACHPNRHAIVCIDSVAGIQAIKDTYTHSDTL